LSEFFDVVFAILLCVTALISAAVTDWFAAFCEGPKHLRRFTFYLLGGVSFALAGVFLVTYPNVSLGWLVLIAAAHALAFGVFGIAFVWKAAGEHRVVYTLSGLSILFSVAMTVLTAFHYDRFATLALGAYACFVGVKMLFLAWHSHRADRAADEPWAADHQSASALPGVASPITATKH